ncbi:hypothetical protein ACJEHO_12905 [Legionella pneumophila]|nr:hypothetical protein [Legionella pneumophila]
MTYYISIFKRVLLQMKKLDIAKLKAAAE